MKLLFLRHAIALDREISAMQGVDDADRTLTQEGIKRMKSAAFGIKLLIPKLDIIAHSPYVRARHTAELLHEHYSATQLMEVEWLAPGHSSEYLFKWLNSLKDTQYICIIGHNPELSECLNDSIATSNANLELKKAGLAGVTFSNHIEKAAGQLDLFIAPKYLRSIGETVKT